MPLRSRPQIESPRNQPAPCQFGEVLETGGSRPYQPRGDPMNCLMSTDKTETCERPNCDEQTTDLFVVRTAGEGEALAWLCTNHEGG